MPDVAAPAIRPSRPGDIAAIQAIYAGHVLRGTASFEQTPPDAAEMAQRRTTVIELGLPHLVAEQPDGRIVGFAYAGLYRPRPAYRHTVEDSIYLDPAATGRGTGRRLLDAVIDQAEARGFRQMVAVIGDSGNAASIALHARAGFRHVGTFRSVGFKFGRWLDTVLMQRPLGPGDDTLPSG